MSFAITCRITPVIGALANLAISDARKSTTHAITFALVRATILHFRWCRRSQCLSWVNCSRQRLSKRQKRLPQKTLGLEFVALSRRLNARLVRSWYRESAWENTPRLTRYAQRTQCLPATAIAAARCNVETIFACSSVTSEATHRASSASDAAAKRLAAVTRACCLATQRACLIQFASLRCRMCAIAASLDSQLNAIRLATQI